MKTIRKFLVKHFVLDYFGNLFGWKFNAPRASRIIYPLMVITGYISVTSPDWPRPTFLVWVFYTLLGLSLFFGFVYFKFFPVVWEELDDLQKYQYGIFKGDELTGEQFREWMEIAEKVNENE